jgi:predicted DNA-binding transcriptional regulator AlpA
MSIPGGFLRIKEVLKLIPVCRATWYNGMKSGRFPPVIKLGSISVWRERDIHELINSQDNEIKTTQEEK